jgi:putative oxidoreductase
MIERLRGLHELLLTVADRVAWLPPLVARVTLGVVFIGTGWGKLHNLEKVVEFFQSLGIPAAEYQAPFVAATELSCGLLLLLGLATRVAAVPLMISMIVAIRTALWSDLGGLNDLFGQAEYLYIALLLWLSISGAGTVSLDLLATRLLRPDRSPGRSEYGLAAMPSKGADHDPEVGRSGSADTGNSIRANSPTPSNCSM